MSYHRLHELNEHIEVLEAAIDFKNDSIASKHLDVREMVNSRVTAEIDQKFEQLSLNDARMLLARYFNKVVHLRVSESHHQQLQRVLEVKLSEQQGTIHRLGRTLKQAEVEKERRLLAQQKVCMKLKYCTDFMCACSCNPPSHISIKPWSNNKRLGVKWVCQKCYVIMPASSSAPENSQDFELSFFSHSFNVLFVSNLRQIAIS